MRTNSRAIPSRPASCELTACLAVVLTQHLMSMLICMYSTQRPANRLLHEWVKVRANPPQRLLDLLDMKSSAAPVTEKGVTKGAPGYRPKPPPRVLPTLPKLKRSKIE